ncbi:MAG: [cytidine(C)-cytidine(C)-adenosine (A)]-adding enzyme [Spirochaetales bacterium]|nr:[cytidine(C)-cytidine(C)-adenosine (A)]-adding enzyme [Spirochaetales bacterium]
MKDLLSPLSADFREGILHLCRTLREGGHQAWLVGGAVRDLLLGRIPEDADLTTSARPEEIQAIFPRTVPTGIKHGTITVLERGRSYEVTAFRSDGNYSDGRHPDQITLGVSLKEDLARRDFTINALAYDPIKHLLIDLFGGRSDLGARRIRAIGKAADRFCEDGLRPVRACRFAASLQGTIEENTYQALLLPEVRAVAGGIAIERFTAEIRKGLRQGASRLFTLLLEARLLELYWPEAVPLPRQAPGEMDQVYPAETRLAFFLSKNGIDPAPVLKHWKFSQKEMRRVEAAGRLLDFKGASAADGRRLLSKLKDLLKTDATEFLSLCQTTQFQGPQLKDLLRFPLSITDLALRGQDLMDLGYRGERLGHALHLLLEKVLDDPAYNTREKLTRELQNLSPDRIPGNN